MFFSKTALFFSVLAISTSAFAGADKLTDAYNQYEQARNAALADLSGRNREDLRDLQASFKEANTAIASMEAFLSAYAIYRANLDQSAASAEQVTALTLDVLSGKAVSTTGVGLPGFPQKLGKTEPVLSPGAALSTMSKALDRVGAVHDRMELAKKALLKDLAPKAPAVVALENSMAKVLGLYTSLGELNDLLRDRITEVKSEIGRNEVEAARVFQKIEGAVSKLLEAKQSIAEAQAILKDAADAKAVVPGRRGD